MATTQIKVTGKLIVGDDPNLKFEQFVTGPEGEWTEGQLETDFPDDILQGKIAGIIQQPSGLRESARLITPALGDAESVIEVNKPWQVDVRWELFTGSNLLCCIPGYWSVKLFLESLGDDELDREARDKGLRITYNPGPYHVRFQIPPFKEADSDDPDSEEGLKVEPDEGTPFELTVAVVFMVQCPGQSARPSSIIGKVNLPLIQCYKEEVDLGSETLA